jgi:hypothetical protein
MAKAQVKDHFACLLLRLLIVLKMMFAINATIISAKIHSAKVIKPRMAWTVNVTIRITATAPTTRLIQLFLNGLGLLVKLRSITHCVV